MIAGKNTDHSVLSLNACSMNYGLRMHPSSLADWLEYNALRGYCKTWQALREEMREAGVPDSLIDARYEDDSILENELFDAFEEQAFLYGDPARNEPFDDEIIETAYQLIERRMNYLGDCYPFRFDGLNRFRFKEGFDGSQSAYVLLLRISVLKGWLYSSCNELRAPLTNLFEQVTAAAMRSAGLQAAVVGTSEKGSFEEKLIDCADMVDLNCDPYSIRHSANAKDDGIDIIGGPLARDRRVGEPIWLVQATCGKCGSTWEHKLMHVDAGKWSAYLRSQSLPHIFLAVPYHITSSAIDVFMHNQDVRSFLDRLRLAKMAGSHIDLHSKSLIRYLSEVEDIESQWLLELSS